MRRGQVYLLNSSGFPSIGGTGTTPYNGTRIQGIQSYQPNLPSGETIVALGDDRVVASFYLPPATEPTASFTAAIQNFTLDALLSDTKTEAIGEWLHNIYYTNKQGDEPEIAAIFQLEGKITDPDSPRKGKNQWTTWYINNAIIQAAGGSPEQRSVTTQNYNVTMTNTGEAFWGVPYTDSGNGATQAVFGIFVSEYPLEFDFYVSSATTATFTLTTQPISVTKTKAYVNGTSQAVSAVGTTSPYTATLTGTVPTGAEIAIIYERAIAP